jgi:carboxymethylenebutenolidase
MRLFDGYVHGSVTRREFLDRAARFAVGGYRGLLQQALALKLTWEA